MKWKESDFTKGILTVRSVLIYGPDAGLVDELCDKVLEIHPYDGETMAIQAKAKLELGNNEEAMELYNKAIFNTRNGIIWQKVEDETGISRIDMERDLIEELKYED